MDLRGQLEAASENARCGKYRKIPKISPSKYKPPGGLYLEIALKYKVKQRKNDKFPSICNASAIDFEMQISLRR